MSTEWGLIISAVSLLIAFLSFYRSGRKDDKSDAAADAAANADTAIVTFSRFSAEGTDRRAVGGDYYLSALEKDLLKKLTDSFGKVIVVQNTGAVMDCEDVAENDRVQGLLLCWQAGMEGGAAVADILCGDVNPSGKLPDTIVRSYDCCPSKDDFVESMQYVPYSEDIYVGYRYYATIPGKADCVRYPFGFGLSYTTFALQGAVCGEADGKITAAVQVANTGNMPGKQVVQLYYAAPQGKLGKPARELAAFAKTRLLSPGDSQTVALTFDIADMASYDDLGKIRKAAYILEQGEYTFYLGTSLTDVQKLAFVYSVPADTVTAQCETRCRPFKLEKRLLADGSYEALPTGEAQYTYVDPADVRYDHTETEIPFDKVGEEITLDAFVDQLTPDELKELVAGQAPTGVANTGCFGALRRLGIPAVPTADGPAGLRLETATGILTTAFPCATLLAATWNADVCFAVGAAAAAELRENNLGVWLAPALNIHRNTLCGRNFEYFSEDPLLAGKLAAAEIRGIQSQKVAVSMKHFACNNKEVNRYASDSRLSERALREIYLKGFEICVREADPWTIMSSYNLINGLHTSENWELLTGILRNEWGFKGMVITDWGAQSRPSVELRAGNDLKMPTGFPEDIQAALDSGELTTAHLKLCATRVLEMFMKLA